MPRTPADASSSPSKGIPTGLPTGLPGDLDPRTRLERLIRVDHAGEFGATRIYAGQLAVLPKDSPAAAKIRHMAAQEEEHLKTFESLIADRRVRPTLLHPLWSVAGFALGAATALMGEKAAMACTIAVEEVIDDHYAAQAASLGEDEAPLKAVIEKFRADEIEHRDTGIEWGGRDAPGYELLSAGVKAASRIAIWLSQRL